MNAYELADELEELYQQDCIDGVADLSMPESANMLRQQADEKMELTGKFVRLADENNCLKNRIAELEKEADRLSNHANELRKIHADRRAELEAQTKPLSDEEIRYLVPWQVWRELPMEIKKGLVRAIEAKVRGEK